MVTEQIANLLTGNRRQGSSPCLSAFLFSGCSVARSSRLVWDQEVAGSNPATPTKKIENFKKIKVRSSAKLSIPILIGTV